MKNRLLNLGNKHDKARNKNLPIKKLIRNHSYGFHD